MVQKSASPDTAIAQIAERQHGIATSAQLVAAGLSPAAISKRAKKGRLHRVHRGVYAVGYPALTREARWMAAVLACGPGAALSHRSAAELWELLRAAEGPIEVTVPSQNGRRQRQGLVVHRCAALPETACTIRNLIPVTAPWWTIESLERVVPPGLYRRAVREAEMRRFALGHRTQSDRTRSDLERDFLALCRRYRLPSPEVNVKLGRWTVDFLWHTERVVVETDSWRFHGGSVAFEDDHVRDLDLRQRGYTVLRFTERQIREEAQIVAADLAKALS